MAFSQITDPVKALIDLYEAKWDNANTSISSDPFISGGWWSFDEERPQITITGYEESPIEGGQTGYVGIDSGNPPVQLLSGTAQVDTWAESETVSVDPQKLVFQMSEEVRRITQEESRATDATVSDFRSLSWFGRTQSPKVDADPVVYRQRCVVGVRYFSFA